MEGNARDRAVLKERMIRPFNRIYQNLLVRVTAQREVITTLLSKKQSLLD